MKLLLLLATISLVQGEFNDRFYNFLVSFYDQTTADKLQRAEIGPIGSYGGGNHVAGQNTSGQAVILVHGITNTAGTFYPQRSGFFANGYDDSRVYATTYGDGGVTTALQVPIDCDFVQRIRWLIQAVYAFTGQQKVDVVGYSFGSPIARKAILGGNCVAPNATYSLGPSIDSMVDTYVSVAGANNGASDCEIPFATVVSKTCNTNNGLVYNSKYIQNINAQSHYEGSYVYSIYSTEDDKVGNKCGTLLGLGGVDCSPIKGGDAKYLVTGNHDAVIANTIQNTVNLVTSQTF